MSLFYYVLGSPSNSSTPIDIGDPTKVDNVDVSYKNLTFGHIKKLILPNNKKSSERSLWKVNIPSKEKKKELEILNEHFRNNADMTVVLGNELDETEFLSTYTYPSQTIHIIVQPPSATTSKCLLIFYFSKKDNFAILFSI